MTLIVLLLLGPALAFLVLVALPRQIGLALALLLALAVAVAALLYSVPGEAAVEDASVDLTVMAALFWGGTAVMAGVLQAARPALGRLGWAAYPLAAGTTLLLGLII